MIKFIHAADIHLDSPLRGLERYAGAPAHLSSVTRQALVKLVDRALEEAVDFLLIAGDLYDGSWRDYNTGLFFATQMQRLNEAEIPVFIVRGNHDAASQITHRLSLIPNVKVLSDREPETIILEELGVAVHGQSYPTRSVTDNLASSYPPPIAGLFNIGLLHTALEGREGHEPYAPCSLAELVNKGYQYWALGHVHQREVVHQNPWIVFPGCLQARHINEPGPKGCTLVTVLNGQVERAEHLELDVLRWCRLQLDCSAAEHLVDVLDQLKEAVREELVGAGACTLALRVELTGATAAHSELQRDLDRLQAEVRLAVREVAGEQGWVERIKLRTTEPRKSTSPHLPTGFLSSYLAQLEGDGELVAAVLEEFKQLRGKLPSDLFSEQRHLDLNREEALAELFLAVRSQLELALSGEEGGDED